MAAPPGSHTAIPQQGLLLLLPQQLALNTTRDSGGTGQPPLSFPDREVSDPGQCPVWFRDLPNVSSGIYPSAKDKKFGSYKFGE